MWKPIARITRKVTRGQERINLNMPSDIYNALCDPISVDNWINYVILKNEKTGERFIAICNCDNYNDLLNTVNKE